MPHSYDAVGLYALVAVLAPLALAMAAVLVGALHALAPRLSTVLWSAVLTAGVTLAPSVLSR